MSDEHFTVDGTLIQAWASRKSFRPRNGSDKDGDGTNFHGGKRSNETHESTTDPDARLYKKSYGKESTLAYLGHALVENRNGLIAQAMASPSARPRCCCSRRNNKAARGASPWAPTRPTTARILSGGREP